MKRTVFARAVAVSSVGALVLSPAVDAFAKTATTTTIVSTAQSGGGNTGEQLKQAVHGSVQPNPPKGEPVAVVYAKKTTSGWKQLGVHHPKLSSDGMFQTAFGSPPKHGVCKLVARYGGDSKYEASKDKAIIACASGQPKS